MGTGRSWTGRGTAFPANPPLFSAPCPISANTAAPRLSLISPPLSSPAEKFSETTSMEVQRHVQHSRYYMHLMK